jgi:hypothetical protein
VKDLLLVSTKQEAVGERLTSMINNVDGRGEREE